MGSVLSTPEVSRENRKWLPAWLWGQFLATVSTGGKAAAALLRIDYEHDFYSIWFTWVFMMVTLYSLLVVDGRRDDQQKGGYLSYFLYCKVRMTMLLHCDRLVSRKRVGKVGSTLLGSEFSLVSVSFEH